MLLVQFRDQTSWGELKVAYFEHEFDAHSLFREDGAAIDVIDVREVDEYFRVVIAGSRDFTDYNRLRDELDHLLQHRKNVVIVSGNANGADKLGEQYAKERCLFIDTYIPDWYPRGKGGPYDKAAGHKRNRDMAHNADAAVIFWDGVSRGSEGMINYCKRIGLDHRVIKYNLAM